MIALVGCGGPKLPTAAPAKNLYQSPLFKAARAYAETFERWFILSAQYGVLEPEQVIEPYSLVLTSLNEVERKAWGLRCLKMLKEKEISNKDFICFAGKEYSRYLLHYGLRLKTPLAHLRIGKRSQWLMNQLKEKA